MKDFIYLDHGATSWPKPPRVAQRMASLFSNVTANAGRSGHAPSLASARILFDAREGLASLLGVSDSRDLVFTRGATEAVNLVLKGYLKEGDRVAISPMEHNAVARPLDRLKTERSVAVDVLPADRFGRVDWDAAARRFENGAPRLVAIAHASNVNGVVQDIDAARKAFPESALLIDAAQTAGVLPIDVARSQIDFLALSAHKGLLGPTGVGACYLNPALEVAPLTEGGTGSASEAVVHPRFRPDRYEAGTMNLHGLAGLAGALEHLDEEGLGGDHERRLAGRLIEGLSAVEGVRLHSPSDGATLLASFTVDGLTPDAIASRLESDFGILCRPGLQCAPMAHQHLGTVPEGTVRLSPGYGNTDEHVEQAVRAVASIVAGPG